MWNAAGVRIDFHASPAPTLGVEWELALVDRRTRDLRNDASHLFARARPRLPDPSRLHQELLRNTVEVVTGICPTVGAAVHDLRDTLAILAPAAAELGVDLLDEEVGGDLGGIGVNCKSNRREFGMKSS